MHPIIKAKRREIIEAFNTKPKNGINMIKDLLNSEGRFESELAEFFITQKRNLDLAAVGDYLSSTEVENQLVLKAFTAQLDFNGQSFIGSLRTFLNTFKLPGEAQKIDRLVESFSKAYFRQNPDKVEHEDAAYVLAFQAILLNTDLHNPSIKQNKKMTLNGMKYNLRKLNNKKDFDEKFLEEIYHEIQNNPFEFHFVKMSPGYELNSSELKKDSTFKKVDLLLQANANTQDIFPRIGKEIRATVDKPKSWLNHFTGYEGTITLTDDTTKASVSVQVYKPDFLSKWLFGEQPKVIIQPIYKDGVDSKSTINLAAKVAAAFEAPVNRTKATYEYEKTDLKRAYQTEKYKGFNAKWKDEIVAKRDKQKQIEKHEPPAPPKLT